MRRKLYSSKQVKKTALVYTQDTEKQILNERLAANICVFPRLSIVRDLIVHYRNAENLCIN